MAYGVSIVVCCHNSAARLSLTLQHLARQRVSDELPWEVVVVDNGSTDATAALALQWWPETASAPLKVVSEAQLGQMHARIRGLRDAQYEVVSFVDDDNWVCEDWVRLVSEILNEHPDCGACGGLCEAAFDEPPPDWFSAFARNYAVGEMAADAAEVTWTKGYLFGAGLTLRKAAWEQLFDGGCRAQLTGRSGKLLTAGDDTEICQALRLAGWKLLYDPRLRLRHFMPTTRLRWDYLRRMRRAFGAASVDLDPYNFALRRNKLGITKPIKENWVYQCVVTLKDLGACGRMATSSRNREKEGDADALKAEWLLGRLHALCERRSRYDRAIRETRRAPWRKVHTPPATSS